MSSTNLKESDGSFINTNIFFFNSNPTEVKETKLKIYLKYLLKRADPLPLIFINPEWLLKFAYLITDNFILNKRYFFNINPHEFAGCTPWTIWLPK